MKCVLADIADVTMGQSPKSEYYNSIGEGIPFLQGNRTFGRRYPTFDTYTTKFTKLAKAGDIIMSVRAPVGDINITPMDMCLGRGVCGIRMKNGNQDFLYYLLKFYMPQLIKKESGTVFGSVNRNDINGLEIDIPEDYNTQKRISNILSAIDEKIDNNEKINDNLFQQMELLYKTWFFDYIPFGGTRPTQWKLTDIYSVANIIYGAPFKSNLFNTTGEGLPIIRIRDLKDQIFVTYTTEKHPKGHLLKAGDIVVGMDGEFRPYIWGNNQAWLNQRVCIFENKRPKGKAFVLFTIKPFLYSIEQTQVATTVIHIGKKDFDAFEFYLPDDQTLNKFDNITTPMIDTIVNNCLENKRLSEMMDNLLPKLMSGDIKPPMKDINNLIL